MLINDHFKRQLETLRADGLFKPERAIMTAQNAVIGVNGHTGILNFCANNYLGLADHPKIIAAAKAALNTHGFGMASVRFICGTQDLHKQLEERLSAFLGMEDTILYSSCFDANGGLFETILDEQDAVISDALNHASIIDGIRLCKARRHRYANNDMNESGALPEGSIRRAVPADRDGRRVFDGWLSRQPARDLRPRRNATTPSVMVDDSPRRRLSWARPGAGTPEHFGVRSRVHILTGTLGKALGGASGGYISGPQTPSSTGCANAPVLIYFPTASRR